MGWADTFGTDPPMFGSFTAKPRFYYVHSFQLVCADTEDVAATCEYGGELVTAAVRRDHICGTQFHPEKSHRYGMTLLEGFARFVGAF